MHLLTRVAVERLRMGEAADLMEAVVACRAFQLASGRFLVDALMQLVPIHEWRHTTGADAIAALELADP